MPISKPLPPAEAGKGVLLRRGVYAQAMQRRARPPRSHDRAFLMQSDMDEMEQTFAEESGIQLFGKIANGLDAVLRQHIQQMIVAAFEQGAVFGNSKRKGICEAARRYGEKRIRDISDGGSDA